MGVESTEKVFSNKKSWKMSRMDYITSALINIKATSKEDREMLLQVYSRDYECPCNTKEYGSV
jgi:hypothetical protein